MLRRMAAKSTVGAGAWAISPTSFRTHFDGGARRGDRRGERGFRGWAKGKNGMGERQPNPPPLLGKGSPSPSGHLAMLSTSVYLSADAKWA